MSDRPTKGVSGHNGTSSLRTDLGGEGVILLQDFKAAALLQFFHNLGREEDREDV